MSEVDDNEGSNAAKATNPTTERMPGKSLFPVARVQKILKADAELAGVAKDAVFLVSMATERFISRVAEAAKSQAGREKRTTVQRKDILTVTRRETEYYFLGDILGEVKATKPPFWASKSAKEKGADTNTEEDQAQDGDGPFEIVEAKKGTNTEDESDNEDREDEEMRSEGVSLPPSSRPSTPLSLGDDVSERPDEVDDEDDMEEDR